MASLSLCCVIGKVADASHTSIVCSLRRGGNSPLGANIIFSKVDHLQPSDDQTFLYVYPFSGSA